MNIAFLIGRVIFGGYWLMASFNHFKNRNYMSEYAKAKGTPSPKLAVGGTGVILLVGGLSMLLGVYPVVGIVLLIIFLLGVSFQMHNFWKVADAQMKQIDMPCNGSAVRVPSPDTSCLFPEATAIRWSKSYNSNLSCASRALTVLRQWQQWVRASIGYRNGCSTSGGLSGEAGMRNLQLGWKNLQLTGHPATRRL